MGVINDVLSGLILFSSIIIRYVKVDKQDQQGKAVFNERNPNTTKQQEPVARSTGGLDSKIAFLVSFLSEH
jgi:hypothetical protein